MLPVIYNTANDTIIQEMQSAGLYDTFQEQMARVPAGPKQIFVFIDATPTRLTYYLYHRGFLLEADNGFSAITILNPAGCPQVVEGIKAMLAEMFDSAIKTLWVEDPQRKN
jgi:hypothetical protein